ARDSDVNVKVAGMAYPGGIPGQRLVLDPDKLEASIVETLHDPQHRAVKQRLEKQYALGPERETFVVHKDDLATWYYWLGRAVAQGDAKLVRGAIPAKYEGTPRKSFVSQPRKDPRDAMISKLVAVLYASLPESKRSQVDAILAGGEA